MPARQEPLTSLSFSLAKWRGPYSLVREIPQSFAAYALGASSRLLVNGRDELSFIALNTKTRGRSRLNPHCAQGYRLLVMLRH